MTFKRYKLARAVGLKQPLDEYTVEEHMLERLLTDHTIQTLYAKLPTPRMKAIVALHFELGYPQEIVADMFNIEQGMIVQEIAIIQRILLGKPYKRRSIKPKIISQETIQYVAEILARE